MFLDSASFQLPNRFTGLFRVRWETEDQPGGNTWAALSPGLTGRFQASAVTRIDTLSRERSSLLPGPAQARPGVSNLLASLGRT